MVNTSLCKFDYMTRGKLNKGKVAVRVAWVPGSQGCRVSGSTEALALQANSVQLPAQLVIQKTCQFMLSPIFVGKFLSPNLGGLYFTAKVGNILKIPVGTQKHTALILTPELASTPSLILLLLQLISRTWYFVLAVFYFYFSSIQGSLIPSVPYSSQLFQQYPALFS